MAEINESQSPPPQPLLQQGRQCTEPPEKTSFNSITDWVNYRFWKPTENNDLIVKNYWISGMTELNLSHVQLSCQIRIGGNSSDTDVDILAGLLRHDATLIKLLLAGNAISDRGCDTIMGALMTNTTLTSLDLSSNGIGDQACRSIVESLTGNNSIVELFLMDNDISNKGFQVLVEGIAGNSCITSLDLLQNDGIDDHELVRCCTGFIERNGVMKRHREEIASIGIAHYIVLHRGGEGEESGQLQWARNFGRGGETHIEEAANAGDGWTLTLFHEALRSVLDGSRPGDNHKEPRSAGNPLLVAIRSKQKLRTLLNTRIGNSYLYVLHLFVQAKHTSTLDMCKFLVYRCGADFDSLTCSDGRTARVLASASRDPGKLRWATEFGSLFGRYRLMKRAVVYRSSTCLVCEAVDIWNTKCDGSNRVALKIMYDHDNFVLEYKNYTGRIFEDGERPGTDGSIVPRFDEKYVMKLLRVHCVDISEVDPSAKSLLPIEQLKEGAKFRVLVMPMVACTVADIISRKQTTGRNYGEICNILHGIASAIKHIHDMRLVHSDVKPENFVRMKNGQIKAIDLDAMIPVGGEFTNKNSRGACTPERAKQLFYTGSTYLREASRLSREMLRTVKLMEENVAMTDKVRMRGLKKTYRRLDEEIDRLDEVEEGVQKVTHIVADFTHDVWSFGIMMFELLTSEPLFRCHTNGDIFDNEKHRLLYWDSLEPDDLRPIMQFDCNSGRCASSLLQKCLQGDPRKRYKSMAQVLKDPYFTGFN